MSTVVQDLRYSLRTLRKSPGFAAAAVGILALGIGANTALFSVVDAVLLRPLPFPEPGRMMRLEEVPPPAESSKAASPANYFDWRGQSPIPSARMPTAAAEKPGLLQSVRRL